MPTSPIARSTSAVSRLATVVETFIDPQRFAGTCYRAANWKLMGQTTGRGKDDQEHKVNRSIKEVLGYPLTKDFRQRLSQLDEPLQLPIAA